MAKSLRSATKKRTRAIKREQVFKPVEDARLERLAKAQAEAAKKESVGDYMEAETDKKAEDAMDLGEKKKISTSGPRSNRHARKLREKKKKGKKSAIKF
ncbi:uncharacterized protein B0P05DRAFT_526867 [Gilbertella persicaria]|uniref:DUF2423 domain-containing protein n=1 Tax=Rhizopus stolonifer TaxID=4846 RepID=A0A367J451_RHIST|nr:uncharacterized protein B0P05DRAFT_526867 [Gilbertella persicaria]KAI8091284.1 hypothetical protein B0P05DRAFT_526867 [Gilbertella persicaria]RCH84686.1 hypothetical protein CU098_002884 [Rhizopus stolonifer]